MHYKDLPAVFFDLIESFLQKDKKNNFTFLNSMLFLNVISLINYESTSFLNCRLYTHIYIYSNFELCENKYDSK